MGTDRHGQGQESLSLPWFWRLAHCYPLGSPDQWHRPTVRAKQTVESEDALTTTFSKHLPQFYSSNGVSSAAFYNDVSDSFLFVNFYIQALQIQQRWKMGFIRRPTLSRSGISSLDVTRAISCGPTDFGSAWVIICTTWRSKHSTSATPNPCHHNALQSRSQAKDSRSNWERRPGLQWCSSISIPCARWRSIAQPPFLLSKVSRCHSEWPTKQSTIFISLIKIITVQKIKIKNITVHSSTRKWPSEQIEPTTELIS